MRKTISTEKLRSLRKSAEGFLLVDIVDAEAFAKDHIPGARNVPATTADFPKAVALKAAGCKTRRVIVYGAGADAGVTKACRQLVEANFTNVFEYEGGLAAWNESKRARAQSAQRAASS